MMKPEAGLAGMERRAWLRVFEDGVWDIGIGLFLIGFGIPILFNAPYFTSFGPLLVTLLFRETKRRVAEPRIGRIRFAPRRQRQTRKVSRLLVALAIAGLLAFALISWSLFSSLPRWASWIQVHFVAAIGLIWGGAVALAARAVEFRRLYLYSALLFGALLGSDLTPGYSIGVAFTSVGAVILLVGTFLLVRFLRRYPQHFGENEEAQGD